MLSTAPEENQVRSIGNLARALVLGLVASVLTLVPVAQEAKASGAIHYNDGICQLSGANYLGSGAKNDPYVISDSESLWETADCSITTSGLAVHFSISNNIDVAEADSAPTSSPIGLTLSSPPIVIPFGGALHGNGYTISGISMSMSVFGVGLFAQVSDAFVSDLQMSGSFSTTVNYSGFNDFGAGALAALSTGHLTISSVVNNATVLGGEMVGGLVGSSDGVASIHSSINSGSVSGDHLVGGLIGKVEGQVLVASSSNQGQIDGTSSIGGFVGFLDAKLGDSLIVDSENVGSVSGEFAGGLVGDSWNSGVRLVIEGSKNSGQISGATAVGGLIGTADLAHVSGSSNTGSVSGSNFVGGLVGGLIYNQQSGDLLFTGSAPDYVSEEINVSNSHNSGRVSGVDYVGGLVGAASNSHILSSSNSGLVSGRDGTGGLAGLIYGDITISGSLNLGEIVGRDGLGGLIGGSVRGNTSILYSTNSGSVSHSVEVGSNEGPVGGLIGAHFSDTPKEIVIFAAQNLGDVRGGSWAVGGLVGESLSFTKIYNSRNSGTIRNLSGVWEAVGGLLGYGSEGVVVSNSHNAGQIFGHKVTGGILGWVESNVEITSSSNIGFISGSSSVGGLIGYMDGDAIVNSSFNSGTVSGVVSFVGGFVGDVDGEVNINTSFNSGTVLGAVSFVGGFAGDVDGDVNITTSSNSGTVSGGVSFVGGFIGNSSSNSNISGSFNSGTISGSSFVGGFIGNAISNSNIVGSFNSGTISGFTFLGGFFGSAGGIASIYISYNNGTVFGAGSFLGGFAGSVGSVNTANTFNAGTIAGSGFVGGLVGAANVNADIANSFNTGTVSGSAFVDGLAGVVAGNTTTTSAYSTFASSFVATSATAEMQRSNTFVGFDFTNTWGFGSCTDNRGFPMLRALGQLTEYNSVGCGIAPLAPETQTPRSGPSAFAGPTLDSLQPRGIIGSELVLTGKKLSSVTGIRIGEVLQTITSVTEGALRFTVSEKTRLGANDVVLISSFGTLTWQSIIQIELAATSLETTTKSALIGKTRMLSKNQSVNQTWFAANLKGSGIKRIVCTVLVAPSATPHQKVQARKQASQVCAQARGHLPSASVWFQTRETLQPRLTSRVLITFRD